MSLTTKILPKPVRDTVKRTRSVYEFGRRARMALGSRLGARYVAGVGGKVHFNDFRLTSTAKDEVAHYRAESAQMVEMLGRALQDAGREWAQIWACLDVGCGYGRVVRELTRGFPQCAVAVCDLNDEAAAFTAREFSVRQVPVVELMGHERDGSFDLVYALDLYTHLDRPMIEMNLARIAEVTRRGGVVVFTTRGEASAATAEDYGQYWLDEAALRAELEQSGFAYRAYPYDYEDAGVAWITADTMRALAAEVAPSLALVAHYPAALGGDQDVFVYQKG